MSQMNSTHVDHTRAMLDMIDAAAEYHRQRNVVLRNQMLISVESSPVRNDVKRDALQKAGMLPYYRGPQ